MVRVRERPPAADGDEAGVAVFGEDHGCTRPVASAQRIASRGYDRTLPIDSGLISDASHGKIAGNVSMALSFTARVSSESSGSRRCHCASVKSPPVMALL
jgi:hypothetical protein